jgi:Zn-dependent protease
MTPPEPSPTATFGPPLLPAPFTSGSSVAAPASAGLAHLQADFVNDNPRYTAATEALEALVAGKGGKTSSQKALLLMVSLAAFVLWLSFRNDGGGDPSSAWVHGAVIIGILFFHELGHFFAMKIFGYKDLSMFFIPFFGAAVTGRKLHAQSWKEAIVTLAGPLPGILIGAPLYIYGRSGEIELIERAGLLMVIINAINLLPIKPLDGGRFFDTILFSRWRWLALLFSAFSTVGFALFLIYAAGWSPIAVGLFTLFQIFVAWKRWTVLRLLEQEAPQAILSPDGTWPTDQAGAMFEAIDAANAPTKLQPKHLAAYALQHLQRQTTPPRIGPTLALLLLYLLPFAYIAIGFFVWAKLRHLEPVY